MSSPNVVHAVLIYDGRYVLQHRDDRPGIAAAGMWALFGGRAEPGEDPLSAVVREVREELDLTLSSPSLLWTFYHDSALGHRTLFCIYEEDVTAQWGSHRLLEGQAVDCFAMDEIHRLPMKPVIRNVLLRHSQQKPDRL